LPRKLTYLLIQELRYAAAPLLAEPTYLFTNPGATLRSCSTPCWICINAPKACGFDIRLCISGFCNCCKKL